MQKRAPTLANILVISLFALSCFGLLLFMWDSFGGSVPLKSKGYRFTAAFPVTLELAEQSEVMIKGVQVGRVISLKGEGDRTVASMELDSRYAPLRSDDRVKIRQKTLLGETFVQIIPGNGRGSTPLPNDGRLSNASVEPIVTLDAILSAFKPKVRHAFQTWMISQAEGFYGNGEALNLSFATLQPFIEDANRLLTVLNNQQGAVRAIVRGTGEAFDALTEREGQLKELIEDGERTFRPAAEASRQFAQAFRELPRFERTSKTALQRLDRLAVDASPLLDQLRPAERALTPLLHQAESFSPAFDEFLTRLGPLTRAAKRGLPDLSKSLKLTTPVLESVRPVLHNIDPLLTYTDRYLPALESFFANLTAATEAKFSNSNVLSATVRPHYLRTEQYVGPESLAVYPYRIGTNRANPYSQPGAFSELPSGLKVFESANCADSAPSIGGSANENVSQSIIEQLESLKIVNPPGATTNSVPAPPCRPQGPFTFGGKTSQFPHVTGSE